MAKGNMAVSGGGTQTAGSYGFKKLGTKKAVSGLSGLTTEYSYKPTAEKLQTHVQEYLDTGKFDMYGSRGASEIAKKIANDLNERGAGVSYDKNYVTVDTLRVSVSKSKKDDKWHAKVSNAGYGVTFNTVVGRYSKKK